MRHDIDSLHQRNLFQQPIFRITDLHISLAISQDMAATQKNRNKLKRSNPMQVSEGLSNPKIINIRDMYLPPRNFIESDNTTNISNNSGVQIIDKSFFAPVQNANKQHMLQSKGGAQNCSTPSPLHQDVSESTETEEQSEFMLVEEYLLQPNDKDEELEINNEENNNQEGEDAFENDEVLNCQSRRKTTNTPTRCCNMLREDRKRFENLILRKINELLEVARGNGNPVERRRRDYSLLPPMPFNDINALQRFDRDLKDNEQMRDQFIQKIQDIGGKTVQKAVKYSMEVVMMDELTQQVVWTLGTENVPKISKFTFPYLIIDVVRNAFDGTKIKTMEDRIADWLRRGGDRIKAARVAANKRREHQLRNQQ